MALFGFIFVLKRGNQECILECSVSWWDSHLTEWFFLMVIEHWDLGKCKYQTWKDRINWCNLKCHNCLLTMHFFFLYGILKILTIQISFLVVYKKNHFKIYVFLKEVDAFIHQSVQHELCGHQSFTCILAVCLLRYTFNSLLLLFVSEWGTLQNVRWTVPHRCNQEWSQYKVRRDYRIVTYVKS